VLCPRAFLKEEEEPRESFFFREKRKTRADFFEEERTGNYRQKFDHALGEEERETLRALTRRRLKKR